MHSETGGVDPGPTFKYWAFISYSHADTPWSTWLHKALERYRVPRQLIGRQTPAGRVPRRINPIFRDRDELPGASSLSDAVAQSLAQSRFLIVICSPHAAASQYVNGEITAFKRLGRSERVLGLIVDGEPGASERLQTGLLEAFPLALRREVGPDGSSTDASVEPLAADVRRGKDGKQNAKLKLIAGMLGVGYDELKQRERHRQRWRLVQAAAAAILIVGTTAGIWLNRQRVVEEQRIRTVASDIAKASLAVTDKGGGGRLSLALQSVRLTRARYSYVLPESEIALYRALAEGSLRGSFVENDTSDTFGGWTWPAAFSTDGSRIVAPSALGPTLLLDADAEKRGVLVDRDAPYDHDLAAIASRGGPHFVTGGADGNIRIWTMDGQLVRRFKAHAADILTLDQSADGSRLVTVGCDQDPGYQSCAMRSARLWTLTGEQLASFVHENRSVTSAAFSPMADRIVTAGESTLQSWLPSGERLFSVTGAAHWVSAASFSADGTRFVTGGCAPYEFAGMFSPLPPGTGCPDKSSPEAEVALYDDRGTRLTAMRGWLAALEPGGTRIVRAWDSCNAAGNCTPMLDVTQPDGVSGTGAAVAADTSIADITFSPGGGFFAVALEQGTITVHDMLGKVLTTLGGFVPGLTTSARFSRDGDRLVTVSCSNPHQGACLERSIHVWDPNGPLLKSLPRSRRSNRAAAGANSQTSVVRVSASGNLAFVASEAEPPHIRNLSTGERVELPGAGLVFDAAFDPAETRIVTIGERAIQFSDLRGRLLAEQQGIPPREPFVAAAAWSRGLVAGSEALVHAWDWNGKPISDLKGHTARVTFIAASPKGDAIASIDVNGRAIVWDGQLNQTISIDASTIDRPPDGGWESSRFDTGYKARFTPDATHLVILGPGNVSLWTRDGQRLWDVAVDPVDYLPPQVSADRVLVVACSERGRGASLGSLRSCYDSAATLWDHNGTLVKRLDATDADEILVDAAAFNAHGNRVVTMNRNGVTRLWDAAGNVITDLFLAASALDFDPKSGRLVTVAAGGSPIHIWQVWDDVDAMMAEADRRLRRVQDSTSAAKAK